jgi:hypothetical protein
VCVDATRNYLENILPTKVEISPVKFFLKKALLLRLCHLLKDGDVDLDLILLSTPLLLWGQPFNCGRQSNVVFFCFSYFFVGHISNNCIGCVGKTQKTRGIFQLKNLPTDGGQLKATDLSTANSSQPEREREQLSRSL